MNNCKYLILAVCLAAVVGCGGGEPPAEKPTGEIDKSATDLSTAQPTNSNDKFNRFQAPN